jgi:hypothetical protein
LCRLAAELLDTEYWRTRGYPDPLTDEHPAPAPVAESGTRRRA